MNLHLFLLNELFIQILLSKNETKQTKLWTQALIQHQVTVTNVKTTTEDNKKKNRHFVHATGIHRAG